MNSRHVAPKVFLALAVICALTGVLLFGREGIGSELTAKDYLNPLFWVTIPRLIPFAISILSALFGLIYYVFEKKSKRPTNSLLLGVHLVSYLCAVLGYATLVHSWWTLLDKENGDTPLPLWASWLMFVGFATCFLAFGANILRSMWKSPRSANNSR